MRKTLPAGLASGSAPAVQTPPQKKFPALPTNLLEGEGVFRRVVTPPPFLPLIGEGLGCGRGEGGGFERRGFRVPFPVVAPADVTGPLLYFSNVSVMVLGFPTRDASKKAAPISLGAGCRESFSLFVLRSVPSARRCGVTALIPPMARRGRGPLPLTSLAVSDGGCGRSGRIAEGRSAGKSFGRAVALRLSLFIFSALATGPVARLPSPIERLSCLGSGRLLPPSEKRPLSRLRIPSHRHVRAPSPCFVQSRFLASAGFRHEDGPLSSSLSAEFFDGSAEPAAPRRAMYPASPW